jgi:hypothetical protein
MVTGLALNRRTVFPIDSLRFDIAGTPYGVFCFGCSRLRDADTLGGVPAIDSRQQYPRVGARPEKAAGRGNPQSQFRAGLGNLMPPAHAGTVYPVTDFSKFTPELVDFS